MTSTRDDRFDRLDLERTPAGFAVPDENLGQGVRNSVFQVMHAGRTEH